MFNHLFKKETVENRNLQIEFDEILRLIIQPFFKELGFKKNGNGFNNKTNEIIQVVNFQKSKWNNNEKIEFAINVGFFSSYLNEKEVPKFLREYDCQIRFRIGMLIKNYDYWYCLSFEDEKEKLINELNEDLEEVLKPFLMKYQSLESLKELISENEKIRNLTPIFFQIKLFLKFGEQNLASEILNREFLEALNPKDSVFTTNFPDGTKKEIITKSEINKVYIETLKEIAKENKINLE